MCGSSARMSNAVSSVQRRVNIKEAWIANQTEGVDRQAAGLGARRDNNIAERRRDRGFLTLSG